MHQKTEVVKWTLVYTKQAVKDAKKLSKVKLRKKSEFLLNILSRDPFQSPPKFEKLTGDLKGTYSRRINIQHRLVYLIIEELKIVKVIRMWSHYE